MPGKYGILIAIHHTNQYEEKNLKNLRRWFKLPVEMKWNYPIISFKKNNPYILILAENRYFFVNELKLFKNNM